jgi:hypothetical protein
VTRVRFLLLCWLPALGWAALPDARVVLVDQARVELETNTLQRLKAEAEGRTDLKPEQVKESIELVLSEILTVLPDAVAAVALKLETDLVVQSNAWPADTESPADATDAVIAEIDRRLSQLKLVIP